MILWSYCCDMCKDDDQKMTDNVTIIPSSLMVRDKPLVTWAPDPISILKSHTRLYWIIRVSESDIVHCEQCYRIVLFKTNGIFKIPRCGSQYIEPYSGIWTILTNLKYQRIVLSNVLSSSSRKIATWNAFWTDLDGQKFCIVIRHIRYIHKTCYK